MHDREAMSPMTESGANDKHARTTEAQERQRYSVATEISLSQQRFFCRNKDFSVTTDLYISKKKSLGNLGCHNVSKVSQPLES